MKIIPTVEPLDEALDDMEEATTPPYYRDCEACDCLGNLGQAHAITDCMWSSLNNVP